MTSFEQFERQLAGSAFIFFAMMFAAALTASKSLTVFEAFMEISLGVLSLTYGQWLVRQ